MASLKDMEEEKQETKLVKIHFLTDQEKETVVQVLQRNEKIRKQEFERKRRLKEEIEHLEAKGPTSSPFSTLTRACPRCDSILALVVRRGCECCICNLAVCKGCSHLFYDNQLCLCSVCYKKILYESKSTNWMNFKGVGLLDVVATSAGAEMDATKGDLLNALLIKLSGSSPVKGSNAGERDGRTYTVYQVTTKRFIDSPPPTTVEKDIIRDDSELAQVEPIDNDGVELHLQGSSDIIRSFMEHQAKCDASFKTPGVAMADSMPKAAPNLPLLIVEPPPVDATAAAATLGVTSDPEANSEAVSSATPAGATKSELPAEIRQPEAQQVQQSQPSQQQQQAGEIQMAVLLKPSISTLSVQVIKCRGLPAGDSKRQRTDSFVKVILLPDKIKRKTKVKKNSANPVFEEIFRFTLGPADVPSRTLAISVWHSTDLLQSNQLLGECRVSLSGQLTDQPVWHELTGRWGSISSLQQLEPTGSIRLALKLESGTLSVWVKEASNLSSAGRSSNQLMDPYVKIYLLPDRSKRGKRSAHSNQHGANPKWNSVLKFDGFEPATLTSTRSLEVSIWDKSVGLIPGRSAFLGGILLSISGDEVTQKLWREVTQKPGTWVEGICLLRDLRATAGET